MRNIIDIIIERLVVISIYKVKVISFSFERNFKKWIGKFRMKL